MEKDIDLILKANLDYIRSKFGGSGEVEIEKMRQHITQRIKAVISKKNKKKK